MSVTNIVSRNVVYTDGMNRKQRIAFLTGKRFVTSLTQNLVCLIDKVSVFLCLVFQGICPQLAHKVTAIGRLRGYS